MAATTGETCYYKIFGVPRRLPTHMLIEVLGREFRLVDRHVFGENRGSNIVVATVASRQGVSDLMARLVEEGYRYPRRGDPKKVRFQALKGPYKRPQRHSTLVSVAVDIPAGQKKDLGTGFFEIVKDFCVRDIAHQYGLNEHDPCFDSWDFRENRKKGVNTILLTLPNKQLAGWASCFEYPLFDARCVQFDYLGKHIEVLLFLQQQPKKHVWYPPPSSRCGAYYRIGDHSCPDIQQPVPHGSSPYPCSFSSDSQESDATLVDSSEDCGCSPYSPPGIQESAAVGGSGYIYPCGYSPNAHEPMASHQRDWRHDPYLEGIPQ